MSLFSLQYMTLSHRIWLLVHKICTVKYLMNLTEKSDPYPYNRTWLFVCRKVATFNCMSGQRIRWLFILMAEGMMQLLLATARLGMAGAYIGAGWCNYYSNYFYVCSILMQQPPRGVFFAPMSGCTILLTLYKHTFWRDFLHDAWEFNPN